MSENEIKLLSEVAQLKVCNSEKDGIIENMKNRISILERQMRLIDKYHKTINSGVNL